MILCASKGPVTAVVTMRQSSSLGTRTPKASHFLGQRMVWKAHLATRHHMQGRSRSICLPIRASFFGVGAPEALLVGVVALVLFGPKGLAQAVKSIGETLKTFAPTIRELTQVSTELKSTLEEEIGLNDLREELNRPLVPSPRPAKASTLDDAEPSSSSSLAETTAGMQQVDDSLAKMVDPEIERRREEAAKMAWGGQTPTAAPAEPQAEVPLANLSIEELEKELARRKAASSSQE